jgi:hypothetical protein
MENVKFGSTEFFHKKPRVMLSAFLFHFFARACKWGKKKTGAKRSSATEKAKDGRKNIFISKMRADSRISHFASAWKVLVHSVSVVLHKNYHLMHLLMIPCIIKYCVALSVCILFIFLYNHLKGPHTKEWLAFFRRGSNSVGLEKNFFL